MLFILVKFYNLKRQTERSTIEVSPAFVRLGCVYSKGGREMKRKISCILCMILVLSLMPASSLATDTTRVYCKTPSTWSQCFIYYWDDDSAPNLSWPGVAIECDEYGVWYYDVPSYMDKLIFNDGVGKQTADLLLPTDDHNMYVFQEDYWTAYNPDPCLPIFYVAGEAPLCGVAWDPDAVENKMTCVDGIYTKTYTNVAAGTYEFKITDGTWDTSWGGPNGSNDVISVSEDNSTVVITFDSVSYLINTEVMKDDSDPDNDGSLPQSLTLVGEGFTGIDIWNPEDRKGDLYEVSPQVYELTVSVVANTTLRFKFVGDHCWSEQWAFGAGYIDLGQVTALENNPGSQDITLTVTENCDLRLTVDLNGLLSGGNATLLVENVGTFGSEQRILTVNVPDFWTSVYLFTWDPLTFGDWPGTKMTKNGSSYQASIPKTLKNLVISGNDAKGNFYHTDDIQLTTDGSMVTITIDENCDPFIRYDGNDGNQPEQGRLLMVVTPDSWLDAYLYTWGNVSTGDFPGRKLSNDNIYYWTLIPTLELNMVISGYHADGTLGMTNDIQLKSGLYPVSIVIFEDGSHVVTYDEPKPEEGVHRVVGNADWMGNWDAASDAGLMEKVAEGVHQKIFKSVQPGNYEFKITLNGKWEDCIGDAQNNNLVFTVEKPSDVSITCSFDAGDFFVDVQVKPVSLGDVTGDDKLNLGDVSKLYAHIRGTGLLDEAILSRADFNQDGRVNIGDAAGVYAYVRGTDPSSIVDSAYALAEGTELPYDVTLTGRVSAIKELYDPDYDNVSVFIQVPGRLNNPILVYRLEGYKLGRIAVGDTITVKGRLRNHDGVIEMYNSTLADHYDVDPNFVMEQAQKLQEFDQLPFAVTLTGRVTEINTPYDSGRQDITFTMEVDGTNGKTLKCFRTVGTEAEKISVNDIVTLNGQILNYGGTLQMTNGKITRYVAGDDGESVAPTDLQQIVDEAYALAPGAVLPYQATLTGKIVSIDTPYNATYQNITVTIVVEGRENKPIQCYRLRGTGAEYLAVGDTITVTGVIRNYQFGFSDCIVEYEAGCMLQN